MSNSQIAISFFLQLAFILATCHIVGLVAKRLGQPQVVAEMIAGVLLGPSLLGALIPAWQKLLFPPATMSVIYSVSQVGLVLYMFLIGVEFDTSLIRKNKVGAFSISITGIITPFMLGSLLVLYLIHQPGLFNPRIVVWQAMLFMGAAISITAFPMLARIILEQGLSRTVIGTLALAAGSIDDAAAWSILAILLAVFSNNMSIAVLAIGGGLVYAVFILFVVKRLLKPLGTIVERDNRLKNSMLALVLILLMICAWITDAIGIYAIFGAFILGAAIPRGAFALHLRKALEPVVTTFLLPLFFVYSGLNTRLNLVDTSWLWFIAGIILLTSFLGKGIACWVAARLLKVSHREAVVIASLMNARGLMELILLNVCLEKGLITPTLFTMLVLMAVATTLMASPLFHLVYKRSTSRPGMSLETSTIAQRYNQPLAMQEALPQEQTS